MTPFTTKILIADDHDIVRAGVAGVLSHEPGFSIIAEAANGQEAIQRYQECRPDITILDLRMPLLDGLGALRAIRELDPAARVLVLTTYDSVEEVHGAIAAGAQGYVLKRSSRVEIVPAVHALLAGQRWIPSEIAARLEDYATLDTLTTRETAVLERIALGEANKQIADALQLSEHTVKDYVKSILKKLDVCDRTEAVVTGLRRGIIRLGD